MTPPRTARQLNTPQTGEAWSTVKPSPATAKESPILFSGPMVRAILEGRKTQTRRVIRLPLKDPNFGCEIAGCEIGRNDPQGLCPYGVPGERLWVRETFCDLQRCEDGRPCLVFAANCRDDRDSERIRKEYGYTWKPSIFMPRWASRITLEITEVIVQRVQEISHRDALAEGVSYDVSKPDGAPVPAFQKLWDSINAKRGYGWHKNPWVWAITFKRIKP